MTWTERAIRTVIDARSEAAFWLRHAQTLNGSADSETLHWAIACSDYTTLLLKLYARKARK